MSIWTYFTQLQSVNQNSIFTSTTITNSSSCILNTYEDGGIVLNLAADIVVTTLILVITLCTWTFYLKPAEKRALAYPHFAEQTSGSELDEESQAAVRKETKLAWYKALCQIWTSSDTTVELRQGISGVRYIHLSEYIIILIFIITIICLCVVLPINASGNQKNTLFGMWCINNLATDSDLLWVHYILAPIFLLIILVVVWIFTAELGSVKLEESERVTIVKNVDVDWDERKYWDYLSAVCMLENVVDIQLGYDVSELYDIMKHREEMEKMVTRYKDLETEEPDEDRTVNTGYCGCCGPEVDGLHHYTTMLVQASEALRVERSVVRTKRCNFVFIVWETPGHCKMFINLHKLANIRSLLNEQYTTHHWQVRIAPTQYDIKWANMTTPKWLWWTRAILINLIILLFVFFLTTPLIIVYVLTSILDVEQSVAATFYYSYLTILLIIILDNILPDIVAWTCKLEKHRTRSGYYHWTLKKTFTYLIISMLLLPLFGFSSVATLLQVFFTDDNTTILLLFECMFSVNNSAFFCNLLIAGALIGRSIELLQVMTIAQYIWERSKARTKREFAAIFKNIKSKYNIGNNYSKYQSYMAIVISWSLICPLLTLFGLFFMVVKYTADKYLMIHCTAPCGSYSTTTHYTSAYFTVFSGILLQLFMFMYAFFWIGVSDGKTILSGIILLLILFFLLTKLGGVCFKTVFPKRPSEQQFVYRPNMEDLKDVYVPPVMTINQTPKRRTRARRFYPDHSRTTSLSSITTLLENSITRAQYRSINDVVDRMRTSISGSSVASPKDPPSSADDSGQDGMPRSRDGPSRSRDGPSRSRDFR